MKRKSGLEQPDLVPKRPPRQDPVSCDSCRKKKLKCDRQRPCSSCLTRRLTCSFATLHSQLPSRVDAHPEKKLQSSFRLNEFNRQREDNPRSVVADAGSQNSRESLVTADWLENIHMGERIPAALSPQLRAELQETAIAISQSAGPARILCSIQRGRWTSNENPSTIDLLKFLPTKDDTMNLFRYYCDYIEYLYHIVIPHVVEGQINEVYRCAEHALPVNPNHLALLFAITGCALFFQFSVESSAHAVRCSQQFTFLIGAALTQANYTHYPTIEGLQAALIIYHNLSNRHCSASVSGFFTMGSIINQAKDMMLHRIDTPQLCEERETQGFDPIDLETKRRLWWDIASLDWFLSFLSGPQEWTYLVNPAFIHTERPLNIDDLAVGNGPGQPLASPTVMTYALERLKFADICRGIVDAISPEQLSGKEVDYAKILDLDRKLQQAQNEIPDFFRLDSTSRRQFASLYQKQPTLAWQRCILQQGYYSRLCRLHRPFFIRGARDPTYSYSYVVGVTSARKVLEIKRIMDEEEPRFTLSSSVIWPVMHHVFMAAVMLLLDVCYNWDDVLAEKRKEEVLDACRMLSKAQQSSCIVKEGIDAMMSVLQKHYKSGRPAATTSGPTIGAGGPEGQVVLPPTMLPVPQAPTQQSYIHSVPDNHLGHGGRELEDIWSEFIDHGGNLEFTGDDWTGLFTELTNATLPAS